MSWEQFEDFSQSLADKKINFIIEPYLRFKDKPGEQLTMFLRDPFGNAIEFKAFKNDKDLFKGLMKYSIEDFHNKAINDYQIKSDWSQEALTEAKLINSDIKRCIILDYPFVTIDGEDAKDFDDAIYCELIDEGFNRCELIADVSHYVKGFPS